MNTFKTSGVKYGHYYGICDPRLVLGGIDTFILMIYTISILVLV